MLATFKSFVTNIGRHRHRIRPDRFSDRDRARDHPRHPRHPPEPGILGSQLRAQVRAGRAAPRRRLRRSEAPSPPRGEGVFVCADLEPALSTAPRRRERKKARGSALGSLFRSRSADQNERVTSKRAAKPSGVAIPGAASVDRSGRPSSLGVLVEKLEPEIEVLDGVVVRDAADDKALRVGEHRAGVVPLQEVHRTSLRHPSVTCGLTANCA